MKKFILNVAYITFGVLFVICAFICTEIYAVSHRIGSLFSGGSIGAVVSIFIAILLFASGITGVVKQLREDGKTSGIKEFANRLEQAAVNDDADDQKKDNGQPADTKEEV